jgi:radical SAM protein with 4Fe4S-binding SPASM domain
MALEKKIFMTLENNMLAFTHFLRALSLHIELSCSSTNYVDEVINLPPTFKIKKFNVSKRSINKSRCRHCWVLSTCKVSNPNIIFENAT